MYIKKINSLSPNCRNILTLPEELVEKAGRSRRCHALEVKFFIYFFYKGVHCQKTN